LKKVATQAQLEDPIRFNSQFIKSKKNLIQFVDAAATYGQNLPSKRGRKRNIDRQLAPRNPVLFPIRQETGCGSDEGFSPLMPISPHTLEPQQLTIQSSSVHYINISSKSSIIQLKDSSSFETILSSKEYFMGLKDRTEEYGKWLEDLFKKEQKDAEGQGRQIILPKPITINIIN